MFQEFRKIARLNRPCVITEKLDGTNAQIYIVREDELPPFDASDRKYFLGRSDGTYVLLAGSRSRWLALGEDNHGFAKWVTDHIDELFTLGEGRHFGEWWGSGINRGYGLSKGEKRFWLFNTSIWSDPATRPACVGCVPVLFEGPFTTENVNRAVEQLRSVGSYASPGFKDPEGIVVYHTHANQYFKVTLKNDEMPKSLVDKTPKV